MTDSNEFVQSLFNQNEDMDNDDSLPEKLSFSELIESIKKSDDLSNNLLSEDIEYKSWYTQTPSDDEIQSISINVPSPARTHSGIIRKKNFLHSFSFENLIF